MSDLRARLADALGKHFPFANGGGLLDCVYGDVEDRTISEHVGHLADVLLSLPGIAIVELPEPDKEVPPHLSNSMAWGSETNIELAAWPQDGVITNAEGEEISPRECREYAAALLAAANAAEIA